MRAHEFIELEEGWREKAAGLATAGALAVGMLPSNQPIPDRAPIRQVEQGASQLLKQAAQAAGIQGTELAQFMAQAAHETANFTTLQEKGSEDYFKKKYDPRYAPKTAKILGNTQPGDGVRYHGRGYFQLTGRDKYMRIGRALGLDLVNNPDLAARPDIAAKIAVYYWQHLVANKVSDFSDTSKVTRAINPARKGLKNRQDQFQKQLAQK
jgi:predicted chitinase